MNKLINFIKGIAIGGTMMVPGVSGGTMALILGIYDEIIHAISTFFKDIKKNTIFLLVVGAGGIIGLVTIAFLVNYCIEEFYYPSMFLFLGVVFGGLPVLYKKADVGKRKKTDWIFLIVGALIIAGLIYFDRNFDGSLFSMSNSIDLGNILFLFLAGIIIAIALILPGVSTSFLLLTLGLYEPLIAAVKGLDLAFLTPIVLGTLFGIIALTKILESLLNNKPRATYMMIIGFVIGSVIEVFPGIPTGFNIVISIITFTLGYIVIKYVSEKYGE